MDMCMYSNFNFGCAVFCSLIQALNVIIHIVQEIHGNNYLCFLVWLPCVNRLKRLITYLNSYKYIKKACTYTLSITIFQSNTQVHFRVKGKVNNLMFSCQPTSLVLNYDENYKERTIKVVTELSRLSYTYCETWQKNSNKSSYPCWYCVGLVWVHQWLVITVKSSLIRIGRKKQNQHGYANYTHTPKMAKWNTSLI